MTCVADTWVGGGISVGGGASVATGPAQAVNSHTITTMMLMINHLLLMLFLRFYFTEIESIWDDPLIILSPHICKIFAKTLQAAGLFKGGSFLAKPSLIPLAFQPLTDEMDKDSRFHPGRSLNHRIHTDGRSCDSQDNTLIYISL